MTGNLNIHVNDADDPDACEFLDLLVSMGLKQHVKGSTYECGQTLDLVITRDHDDVVKSVPVIEQFISETFRNKNVFSRLLLSLVSENRRLKALGDNAVQ